MQFPELGLGQDHAELAHRLENLPISLCLFDLRCQRDQALCRFSLIPAGVRTAMESLTVRQYEVIDDHNKGVDFFSSFHLFFHILGNMSMESLLP